MRRHPSRGRSVTRLLILALGVVLLGSTLAPAPDAAAQAPPLPPLPTGPSSSDPARAQLCAVIAAGQPAAVRDQLLVQAGCLSGATAFNWGIHANGWHVCIRNRTGNWLGFGEILDTDNIAERPAIVHGWSDDCTLRGQPSIYGGPANINFTIVPTNGDKYAYNTRLVSWHPRGTSPEFNFTCDVFSLDDDAPVKCTVVRGTMQQPIFVILEPKS